jgi:hypothetical protein
MLARTGPYRGMFRAGSGGGEWTVFGRSAGYGRCMGMRLRLTTWIFAGLAAAAAGCAGSGGGSLPPAGPGLAGGDASHAALRRSTGASLVLRIPARRRHRRHGDYISAGTRSLSVSVIPAAANATPMPPQIFNVATPSPCKALASGALQCTFEVLVRIGGDRFTIAAYASPNAKGSPLSTYSSGVETIPGTGKPPALDFSLEGIVNGVSLGFKNPVMPLSATSAAIPAGTAAPVALDLKAYDAAGFQILEASPAPGHTMTPFDAPLTVAVSPAGSGVTLSTSIATSASTVSIAGPSDAATLAANYDGSLTYAANALLSSWTISASPSPGGTPAAATLKLASSGVGYSLGQPRDAYGGSGAWALAAKGNLMYASLLDSTVSTGATVAFSQDDPSQLQTVQTGYIPSGTFFDSYGDMWVLAQTNAAFYCYAAGTPAGGTPALTLDLTALDPGATSLTPEEIAQDSTGQLWFSFDGFASPYYQFGIGNLPMTGACSGTPQVAVQTLLMGGNSIPNAMAPLPSGAGVWVGDLAQSSLYQAVPNPGRSPSVTTYSLGSTQVQALATHGSTVDAVSQVFNPSYATVTPSGTLSAVGAMPWSELGQVPVIGASGTVAAPDLTAYGMDLYDPASGAAYFLPLQQSQGCSAAAFDAHGNPWALCQRDAGGGHWTVQAYRAVLTPTWGVFPGTDIAVTTLASCPIAYRLAAAEALGQDSGPFTAVSDTPSVVSVSGPVAGYTHLIGLTVRGVAGTAVVTVADAHQRSVPVTFTVTTASGICGGMRHGLRRPVPHPHARGEAALAG